MAAGAFRFRVCHGQGGKAGSNAAYLFVIIEPKNNSVEQKGDAYEKWETGGKLYFGGGAVVHIVCRMRHGAAGQGVFGAGGGGRDGDAEHFKGRGSCGGRAFRAEQHCV